MKCPGRRLRPRAWAVLDDDDNALTYVAINPLRHGAKYASVPASPIFGFNGVFFREDIPNDAIRLTCPLQNDEAYEIIERAVNESAITCGFYPDSMGPLFRYERNQPEEGG